MAQLIPLPLTISCSSKSRLVCPFRYRLSRVVPDKGPLNGCCSCITVAISNAKDCLRATSARKKLSVCSVSSLEFQFHFITSAEGGYVFGSVCLSVCLSYYSQTCERILTKFFVGVGHGSRTKWYNFGGDPDHASDPGVQSPKSGSSGSAEVCAL